MLIVANLWAGSVRNLSWQGFRALLCSDDGAPPRRSPRAPVRYAGRPHAWHFLVSIRSVTTVTENYHPHSVDNPTWAAILSVAAGRIASRDIKRSIPRGAAVFVAGPVNAADGV